MSKTHTEHAGLPPCGWLACVPLVSLVCCASGLAGSHSAMEPEVPCPERRKRKGSSGLQCRRRSLGARLLGLVASVLPRGRPPTHIVAKAFALRPLAPRGADPRAASEHQALPDANGAAEACTARPTAHLPRPPQAPGGTARALIARKEAFCCARRRRRGIDSKKEYSPALGSHEADCSTNREARKHGGCFHVLTIKAGKALDVSKTSYKDCFSKC